MNALFQNCSNAWFSTVRLVSAPGGVSSARRTIAPSRWASRPALALSRNPRAFTLIELILVMAMLAAIMSVAAPKLSRFFAGRSLELESARLLSLTRYGQNHAVSSGTPMVLWIDVNQGAYGMREQSTFKPGDQTLQDRSAFSDSTSNERPLEYFLAKDLELYLDNQERRTNGVATIIFYPDGSIDENSLKLIFIQDKDRNSVPIVQTRNRLHYEISDQTNRWNGTKR